MEDDDFKVGDVVYVARPGPYWNHKGAVVSVGNAVMQVAIEETDVVVWLDAQRLERLEDSPPVDVQGLTKDEKVSVAGLIEKLDDVTLTSLLGADAPERDPEIEIEKAAIQEAGSLAAMLAAAKSLGDIKPASLYPITWRTHDGRTLYLEEMSDDHLRASIYMLRRSSSSEKSRQIEMLRALDNPQAADQLASRPLQGWYMNHDPKYRYLVEEAERRGLDISATRDWPNVSSVEPPPPFSRHDKVLINMPGCSFNGRSATVLKTSWTGSHWTTKVRVDGGPTLWTLASDLSSLSESGAPFRVGDNLFVDNPVSGVHGRSLRVLGFVRNEDLSWNAQVRFQNGYVSWISTRFLTAVNPVVVSAPLIGTLVANFGNAAIGSAASNAANAPAPAPAPAASLSVGQRVRFVEENHQWTGRVGVVTAQARAGLVQIEFDRLTQLEDMWELQGGPRSRWWIRETSLQVLPDNPTTPDEPREVLRPGKRKIKL